jgi:ABC-2 type transport system permease protein
MSDVMPATVDAAGAVRTLASVTFKRMLRGKALWIGASFAVLPVIYAVAVHGGRIRATPNDVFGFEVTLLAVLPALFIAASLGDELEDRTSAYLWSRPLPRWALLAGKLCALAPVVALLLCASWWIAATAGLDTTPTALSTVALAAGCLVTSVITAGIATVVPKHGMALAIGYMLVDLFIGALPFSLDAVAITHQTRALAGVSGEPSIASGVIAMAAIAVVWGAIAVSRIRKLEV